MKVVRVRVVTYEDDHEVANFDIGYYEGQSYAVEVVTPDGKDATTGLRIVSATRLRQSPEDA